jgi:hypothetical protein
MKTIIIAFILALGATASAHAQSDEDRAAAAQHPYPNHFPPNMTLWALNSAGLIAGPLPTIERGLNSVIPGGLAPGDAAVQAGVGASLTGVLFCPGRELDLDYTAWLPRFWDTSAAYAARLRGIDDQLRITEVQLKALPRLSEREYEKLLDSRDCRAALGVPAR